MGFRIPPLRDDNPIKGIKQFGILSENGQKYRDCIRKQQEQGIWNRDICMPNLKKGKGNPKKKAKIDFTITDNSTVSLGEIPWSQKVLKSILDGSEIDDYLEIE